jgi:hypothetical protein
LLAGDILSFDIGDFRTLSSFTCTGDVTCVLDTNTPSSHKLIVTITTVSNAAELDFTVQTMTLPLATATNLSSIQILDSSNNQLASSADITFNLMSQALTVTGEPYGVGEMDFVFTSLQKEIEINSEIIVSIGITKMSFHELE